MIATWISFTSTFPMSYCVIAVAVPTVVSLGLARPTGRFEAPLIGVSVPSGLRTAKVTVAVVMFPWQLPPVSRIVAVRAIVDVLLLGPVVQKKVDPVYNGWPFNPPTFVFGVTVNGLLSELAA